MILDGKIVKEELLNKLKEKIDLLDRKPSLTVIQLGENPASNIYVRQKEKMAEKVGINFNHIKLEETTSEEQVLSIIDKLNNDNNVDGILVQMPLPKHIDERKVQNRIIKEKDVDGLTDINMGMLSHESPYLSPCTPEGIMYLLDYYKIDVEGKDVVIVGRSNLVGKPLAALMMNKNATVTVCHTKTKNLSEHTKKADILVVAAGCPKLIKREDVKENSCIIDVGITRLEDNSLCGDVDFNNVKDKVKYITPVPGGVGQMTVALLGYNTYKAYKNNIKL